MSLFADAYGSAGAVLMAAQRRTPGHHIRHQGEPASTAPFGVEKPAAAVISQARHSLSAVTVSRCSVPRTCHDAPVSTRMRNRGIVPWLRYGTTSNVIRASCLEQEETLLMPHRFSVGQSVAFLASPLDERAARPSRARGRRFVPNGSKALFRFQTASGTIVHREGERAVRKVALGRAGADLKAKAMQPHGVLFIDAGSTNLSFARALPLTLRITIVTNAPHIATVLAPLSDVELIIIGGRLDPRCDAALGAKALRDLEAIRIDLALLGTRALDAAPGLATFDMEDAEFKRTAAQASAMIVTTATNDKLGTSAPFRIIPSARLTHLIIEADVSPALLASFEALGIKTHRAPGP
jgi:DeoR/GlpR family transcriptional regulator of sugar metabolism